MREHRRHSPAELEPQIVNAFASTFIARLDVYPWQQPDGKFITVHRPLTPNLITAHLKGHITLGAYALDEGSMAHWICLDADDEHQWQGLLHLASTLQEQSLMPYLETSRRGGHLWLFTSPLPGLHARRFATHLLADYDLRGIEIYPKQDQLVTGPGSLVRLPFGIHRKSGRRYHFITPEGQPLAPSIREQLELLAFPTRLPLPFVISILAKSPVSPPETPQPTPEFHAMPVDADLPLSERLKASMSVLDFVSQYVALDGKHTGICPFHDDTVHSFSVNPSGNYWHCFAGCGGGSLIDFWMQWRASHNQDSSFTATVRDLKTMLL